jgi:hypothetical protein
MTWKSCPDLETWKQKSSALAVRTLDTFSTQTWKGRDRQHDEQSSLYFDLILILLVPAPSRIYALVPFVSRVIVGTGKLNISRRSSSAPIL